MNAEFHDLVGAYAVDAVDPAERELFEAHLAECPTCADELAAFREVLATLADAHAVVPPARVTDAVLDAARRAGDVAGSAGGAGGSGAPERVGEAATSEAPGGTGAATDGSRSAGRAGRTAAPGTADRGADPSPAGPEGASDADLTRDGTAASGRASRADLGADPGAEGAAEAVVIAPRRRAPLTWLAAAAAAAVLFAGGVVVGRQTTPSAPVASDDPMASVLEVAAAGDAHFLPVEMMGAESRVVMSGEMDKSVFLASDLPTPAKGMCYQVWRVDTDGSKESAGIFVPDADGHVAVVLEGGADVSAYVITVEPPGGSTAPTGEMVGQVST